MSPPSSLRRAGAAHSRGTHPRRRPFFSILASHSLSPPILLAAIDLHALTGAGFKSQIVRKFMFQSGVVGIPSTPDKELP